MELPQTPPPFNLMGINGQCVPNMCKSVSVSSVPKQPKNTKNAHACQERQKERQERQECQSRFATPIYARPLFKTPCMLAIHFNPHSTEYFFMQTPHSHQKHRHTHSKTPKHAKTPKKPHFRPSTPKQGQTTHAPKHAKNALKTQNTGVNNHAPQNSQQNPPNRPKSLPPAPILDIYSRIKEMDINHKHYFGELQAMCQNQMSEPKAMLGHIYQQAGEYCQALNDDINDILARLEPFCELPFDDDDDDFPFA